MSLADYQPARESVQFRGGSFQVRGLSADDLGVLLKHHLPDLDRLFELYAEGVDERLAVFGTAQYAIKLVQDAPGLTAHVIALAADEPEMVDKARQLSIPVQVEALKTIVKLTFEEAGGPKNFFEGMKKLVMAANLPTDMTAGSRT